MLALSPEQMDDVTGATVIAPGEASTVALTTATVEGQPLLRAVRL